MRFAYTIFPFILFALTFLIETTVVSADSPIQLQPMGSPSLVDSNNYFYAQNPVGTSLERKVFYNQGGFWIFYSDGTNIVYRTSQDGFTWSNKTVVSNALGSLAGSNLAVWLDGNTIYYALTSSALSSSFAFRYGTLNTDGTISWNIAEQKVSTNYTTASFGTSITKDSLGNIWVAIREGKTTSCFRMQVFVYSSIWTGVKDTPCISNEFWSPALFPLSSGVALLYSTSDTISITTTTDNGKTWSTPVSTKLHYAVLNVSAVSIDNTIYVAGPADEGGIKFFKYDYGASTISDEQTVETSGAWTVGLSTNSASNLILLYSNGKNIFYKTSTDRGAIWSQSDIVSSNRVGINYVLTPFLIKNNLPVFWTEGDTTQNIMFAEYNLQTATTTTTSINNCPSPNVCLDVSLCKPPNFNGCLGNPYSCQLGCCCQPTKTTTTTTTSSQITKQQGSTCHSTVECGYGMFCSVGHCCSQGYTWNGTACEYQVKLKILIVPVNWDRPMKDFDYVAHMVTNNITEAFPFNACPSNVKYIIEDQQSCTLPYFLGIPGCYLATEPLPSIQYCAQQFQEGGLIEDYDYVIGIEPHFIAMFKLGIPPTCNTGQEGGWALAGFPAAIVSALPSYDDVPGATIHELGHIFGLQDEYCDYTNSFLGAKCGPTASPNPLLPQYGCDVTPVCRLFSGSNSNGFFQYCVPNGSCCTKTGSYEVTCLGDIAYPARVIANINDLTTPNYGPVYERSVMSSLGPQSSYHFSEPAYKYLQTIPQLTCG